MFDLWLETLEPLSCNSSALQENVNIFEFRQCRTGPQIHTWLLDRLSIIKALSRPQEHARPAGVKDHELSFYSFQSILCHSYNYIVTYIIFCCRLHKRRRSHYTIASSAAWSKHVAQWATVRQTVTTVYLNNIHTDNIANCFNSLATVLGSLGQPSTKQLGAHKVSRL